MLYFAYGSNLCTRSMSYRCPAAEPLGPAMLMDWRMTFRGVADVEPAEGEIAYGAVWRITPACERALDSYEGVAGGFYRREFLTIETEDGPVEALVYVMNPTYLDKCSMPSVGYFETIARGYADFGLDLRVLEKILADTYDRIKRVKGITEFVPHGPKRMGPAGTVRTRPPVPKRQRKAARKAKVAARTTARESASTHTGRAYAVTTRSGIPLGNRRSDGRSPATRALEDAEARERANRKAKVQRGRESNATALAILEGAQ